MVFYFVVSCVDIKLFCVKWLRVIGEEFYIIYCDLCEMVFVNWVMEDFWGDGESNCFFDFYFVKFVELYLRVIFIMEKLRIDLE